MEVAADFTFLGSKTTVDGYCSHEIERTLAGRKAMTNLDSVIKKQKHHFVDKGPYSQSYGFSSSHIWMWELDYKESWVLKNWCSWTVVLEKTLKSPLDCKEIQPVHPKWNQSWMFTGRTDVEAETPILWQSDAKNWLIGKRPWCWERLKPRGEGNNRGWDGWMASPTQWTWVWVNSRSWWWTGKAWHAAVQGVAKSWHDWATELKWTDSFSSSNVWIWELDHREAWVPNKWCFSNCGAGEDSILRVPWTARRSNQSILKEINPAYSLEGLMLKLQDFGDLMQTVDSLEDSDAEKDWEQEDKMVKEDEMIGWHHRLNGHGLNKLLQVREGQGSLACCSPWGRKESDTTEWLNNNKIHSLIQSIHYYVYHFQKVKQG